MAPRAKSMVVLGVAIWACASAAEPPVDRSDALAPVRERLGVPAFAFAVTDREGVLAWGVSGARSVSAETPVQRTDRFHVGSLTKSMTAMLFGVLVDRGDCRWETTIAEASPELAAMIPERYAGVTVEQLLAHRAGLPDDRSAGALVMRMWMSRGPMFDRRRRAAADAFNHEGATASGEGMRYSNAGYIAAGHIAEAITGDSWEELIAEHVFGPLGMTTAGFGPPGTGDALDEPVGHLRGDGGLEPVGTAPMADNPEPLGPAGRVHCSIEDLAAFARAHLAGLQDVEGPLGAETIEKLHADPEGDGYALGWGVSEGPDGRRSSHAGSNGRWLALIAVDPDRDLAVVVAMNAVPEGGAGPELMGELIGLAAGDDE